MKKRSSIISCVVLALAFIAIYSFAACAANSKLSSPTWEQGKEAPAVGGWEYALGDNEKRPTFYVVLYRGNEDRMTAVLKTKETFVDFAPIIAQKGTGVYYYRVSMTADVQNDGLRSESVIFDGEDVRRIKEYVKNQSEAKRNALEAGILGWVQYPDQTWKYRLGDGTYATGWLDDGGQRYYLSADGTMLTGWQIIGNRWYCFAPSGALYRNTTTPDGYTVDASGVCLAGGVPVDGSWQPKNNAVSSAKTLTRLKEIRINSTESKVANMVVRPMRVTANGKFTVERYSFSKPYEQWQPGVPIVVTVSIVAYTGYSFADDMKVTFNRGELMSSTGNATERVITYRYYPRMVLDSPTNVSFDGTTLSWSPVDKAFGYILKVSNVGGDSPEIATKKCSFDLSELLKGSDAVSIYAVASDSMRNYYYDSFPTVISDLDSIRYKGNFTYVGKRVKYTDENGDLAEGWAEMNGNWYHFTKGLSEPQGWWQDGDRFWYYFDNYSRMMTGEITDGGKKYFLNDGSVKDIPKGAWVENH